MLNSEDEDRKKRLEEARNIISKNNINNGTEYDTKIQEANSIINSINPPKVKEIAEEQIVESRNNANEFIDFIEQNLKNVIEEEVKKEEPSKNNTISKIENQTHKDNQISINTNSTVKEENNFRNIHGTSIQNNNIKLASNEESKNIVKMNNYDANAQIEANKKNEQIKQGGVEGFNATVGTVLKNIQGGVMNAVAGLANVVTTAVGLGTRGLEAWAYVLGKEDIAKQLNDFYNKTVDKGQEISNKAGYESNVTARIENEGVKTAGMVTNVVSEMATNAAIGYVLPGGTSGKLGTTIQGLSVGGRSAQEVLSENKDNIKQATITGIAKGFTSYLTEKMFDANILTKGNPSSISDKVDDLIFNNIENKFGAKFASKTVGIIGENIEELAEDNIGNVIDYIVNDKDFPTIKEWWNNTSETAKLTTISTIVMGMLGLGGSDFENKQDNYLTRKIEKYIDDNSLSIQYDNMLNQESNNNPFYITNFNQDGDIESIQTVKGKEIINPNKKVNVKPVIVDNNGNYNVIDSNTGLLLDNAPYRTIIEAESRFNNKMINLDNATINNINHRVTQANVVIDNKIQEITNSVQSELNAQETVQSNQNVEPITQTPLKNVEDTLKNGQENVENSINTNQMPQSNTINDSTENKSTLNMFDRNFETVSDTKVKAYQEEHPEMQTEIQEMAVRFMEDLANTSEGRRYKLGDEWNGQKRSTTKELAQIKDSTGATWNQIGQALEDIANNKGNYALAKKIEIVLDDTLTNGYKNIYGQVIMPNEEYLAKKSKIEAVQQNKINEDNNLDNYRVFDEDISKSKNESVNKVNLIKNKKDISSVPGFVHATERNNISQEDNSYLENIVGNDTIENEEQSSNNSITQSNELNQAIENFKQAKGSVDRNMVLSIANSLNIKIKEGSQKIIDTEMSKKAGHNQTPIIVNVTELFKDVTSKNAKGFRNDAINEAMNRFRDKQVTIKDTRTTAEINKSGIEKTFSGSVTESKIQTADNLDNIIEEGIFSYSTQNPNSKDGIIYHHFFAPVEYKGNNGLIRVVIKEYTQNKTANDKFYYHQLEYINNKKIEGLGTLPRQAEVRNFKPAPSVNISIPQNNQSVKNNTNVNNKSMQNNENNTLEDIKKELHNRIQNAILSKNSRKNTFLGTVSDKVASKIKSLFDIDVSGRKHIITDYDIRHIIKQHGNSEIEKAKGQIAITTKDIEKIPDIIEKYDNIIEGNDNKQGKTIRYIKKYPDNKTYVVEVIPDANDKTLYIKTMWKKPITLTNSQKTPSSTSKTRGNSSSSTSSISISQNEQNVKGNTNIQDFGEKIGGARKDISTNRSNVNVKQVTHDYAVQNTDTGFAVTFKNNILKEGFKTQAEAEKYIIDFKENIKSNLAFVKDFEGKEKERYLIYIRNPRSLKSIYAGKEFSNKQEAENYAMALSMYLKEYGKALERPSIQKVNRINVESKNATKTTGNDILNNFGFKGGEFGNWVKQSERQEFLNYAQNAFTDLAEALDIDQTSLGQNGEMNIAFGARGRGNLGGQAAVAHFEPGKRVINMTRLKGAGSLAHEYGHSIDNWLSRISGYSETGMASTNPRNPNLSEKMKNAIKNVGDAMQYNISKNKTEIDKKNQIYEKGRKEHLEYYLKSLDNIFSGKATKYKRIKGNYEQVPITITEQQKQDYQRIRNNLINGEITEDVIYKTDPRTLKTEKIYPEPIAKLQKMYKEIVGRKLDEDNTVYWLYRYGKPTKQVSEVKSESAYLKSAVELDRLTGRSSKYFSKTEEMWARAFEAYVSDKLKQKGIVDTYLVHSVNNNDYALFNPYPAGEERININKAFDNLIKTMKDEGIFKAKEQKALMQDNGIRYEKIKGKSNISKPYNAKENEGNIDIIKSINQNDYLKNLTDIDNEQGATNAQSVDRRIEQEIREAEGTGSFDDTIPITKLTDINNMIKNFLRTHIQKGHFRQHAYGFYNPKTNTIRLKENKDMDNVLHEMGHVLDIKKKVGLDKNVIADELIGAANKHGGYEEDTRSVQMEEGFAEIIKEYAINPSKVKIEYPQTYSILVAERHQNKTFDNFMTDLQGQIYNYIHQNPRNRILSNQSIGEQTDKVPLTPKSVKEKIIKMIWDKGYPVKVLSNEFAKASGATNEISKNVYVLTRLASGINNKAISMISDGYIDINGKQTMPGLNKLGEILGEDPQKWNDLRAYLVAKRDLEYKAKSLKTGIRTMDSKAVINQFANDVQIQQAAQVVYDTLDGVLQYAIDNGLMNQEDAKTLKESNVFYVPFQRVLEGRKNQISRRGAVSEIIRKRTGSELDIKDVLENIVTNSVNIIEQVEKNNVLKTTYEQGIQTGLINNIFEEIPAPMMKIGKENLETWKTELTKQGVDVNNLDLEKTKDIFIPNNNIIAEKDGSHIVSFFDKDGKRRYIQFYKESTDIFNALLGMDSNANSMFLKIMSKLNMPLRYGATMGNIGFAIPNLISDTAQATIFSEAGFFPVVDNILGVLDVLTVTNDKVNKFVKQFAPEYAKRIEERYKIYQQTGASSSTRLSQYRKSVQEIMKDVYGVKNKSLGIDESFKPLKRLLDIFTYIPELSENSTRFRVFERNYEAYKKKGGSELDARIKGAIESRDATQDFGRTGTFMTEINKIVPFSAARVGSAYTFAEKVKANPKRVAARTAILLTLAMIIKGVGYDDDEIEEVNQRTKDNNFIFKIGDTVMTLKKPQGILRSVVNLTEYVQDLVTGHIEEGREGERLAEWLSNALKDNLPADSPLAALGSVPIVGVLAENAANKDFYFNTDIVKSWDLDLPEEQQYYDYNSQLAIALGQIFKYSPAKIDNIINGYFGSLGTQTTNIIDYISGKLGFSPEEPEMGIEDNAVGKRFVVNVNENSASIDEIYNREEEFTKKLNGGTITSDETKELEVLREALTKLSALNKQIKAIKQDLTMSGIEKANKIRPLQEQKTDVARQALGKETIYSGNTDNLNALEFYPTRNTLDYNGFTLNLTEEMKQEYMTTAYNLYEKYEKQGLYNKEYLEKLKSKIKGTAKKQMLQKYKNKLTRGGN